MIDAILLSFIAGYIVGYSIGDNHKVFMFWLILFALIIITSIIITPITIETAFTVNILGIIAAVLGIELGRFIGRWVND